jgi:hypothetical protein
MSSVSFRWPAWAARRLPVLAIAGAAALVPGLLLAATAGRHVTIAPVAHLVVVGAAGALAAVAATALSVIAARVNDGRAVLLGMSFSVMATMLVVHALSTPGAWLGDNGLMQLAGAVNVPAGAVILAASALPWLQRERHAQGLLRFQLALLGALLAAAAVALVEAARIRRSRGLPATPPDWCSSSAPACSSCSHGAPVAPTCSRVAPRTCS